MENITNILDLSLVEVDIVAIETLRPIINDHWHLFVSLLGISSFLLLFSLLIYLLIWDRLSTHGWIQFSYMFSLLLFNLAFIPSLIPQNNKKYPSPKSHNSITLHCYLLSLLNQFLFIFSKSWLLVISFDILWTLRKFRPFVRGSVDRKKYWTYFTISFLIPFLMVSAGISLNIRLKEKLGANLDASNLWVPYPDYGNLHCRIPNWDIWEYFIFSNCIIHLLLFILIIFTILHNTVHLDTTLAQNYKRNYESFLIFLRLFIIVGVSWIYIALQDILNAGNINTEQYWIWDLFRILFFSQGIFVSLIYSINRRTYEGLSYKFPNILKRLVKLKRTFKCEQRIKRISIQTISSAV